MKLCSITYIRIYTVLNDFIYINDSVERSLLLLVIHGLLWWLCISGLSHKSPPDTFEFFLTVAIVCWDPVLSLSDWQNHQKRLKTVIDAWGNHTISQPTHDIKNQVCQLFNRIFCVIKITLCCEIYVHTCCAAFSGQY